MDLRNRFRGRLGTLARRALTLIPRGVPIPIVQGPMRGKLWISDGMNWTWLGMYELEAQRWIANQISPGHVVYDIGAHRGYYTLLAATLVGAQGRVVAFEPDPSNLPTIRRHIALNRIRHVDIIQAAVSSAPGTARFLVGPDHWIGKLNDGGDLEVRVVSIDDEVEAGRLSAPDVIKIDAEGAEMAILHGALETIQRYRPAILVEAHGVRLYQEVQDFMSARGYDATVLSGRDGVTAQFGCTPGVEVPLADA
jgi:FkbM family methyltransferase